MSGTVRPVDVTAERARVRAERRAIGAERAALDDARHRLLVESGLLDGAARVAAYVATDGEADAYPWRHVGAGLEVYLPVVAHGSRHVTFHRARGPGDIVAGRWGIPEPARHEPRALSELDAVLVPGVLFDVSCARVGRGRGYYDRTLEVLDRQDPGPRPVLIGLAFDLQVVDAVPQHPGDVPLDAVVTPTSVYRRPSVEDDR